MDEVDQDRHSNDADRKLGYKNGSFIDTIARHADCILGVKSTFHQGCRKVLILLKIYPFKIITSPFFK